MKTTRAGIVVDGVIYPETDGEPMASNTQQAEVMITLKGNLDLLFADRDDVFIAMDLFWYPVKGDPTIRMAPDVMVVFGRPKGMRGAYLQFEEENIPPQVVFEIVSPGNKPMEWVRKFQFYEQYGVQEYYIYDPETSEWEGNLRRGAHLEPIESMEGWVSPLLKIKFTRGEGERVKVYHPDGRLFISYVELGRLVEQERQLREQEQRLREQERQLREEAERRADRFAQKLRELGVELD